MGHPFIATFNWSKCVLHLYLTLRMAAMDILVYVTMVTASNVTKTISPVENQ